MKTTVLRPTEITITHIKLTLPVRYKEEDIPNDFPLRSGDVWQAMVNIDTGVIHDWPKGKSGTLEMKVCDEGTYTLYSDLVPNGVKRFTEVAKIEQDYVPHGVVPGESGDYVHLTIDANGCITNWPKKPDVSAFFEA